MPGDIEKVREIIQMIPAKGIIAIYEKDGVEYQRKVDIFALDNFGAVNPYKMDEKGWFDIPHESPEFIKYIKDL